MRFALFREVPKRAPRKKRRLNNGGAARKGSDDGSDGGESDEDDGSEDEVPQVAERMTSPNAPGSRSTAAASAAAHQQRQQQPADPIWGDDSQDVTMDSQDVPDFSGGPPPPTGDGNVRPERYVLIAADYRVFTVLLCFSVVGCSSSVLACPRSLLRVCKMRRLYSYLTCSRPLMKDCRPSRFTELLKQPRYARLWERQTS